MSSECKNNYSDELEYMPLELVRNAAELNISVSELNYLRDLVLYFFPTSPTIH